MTHALKLAVTVQVGSRSST